MKRGYCILTTCGPVAAGYRVKYAMQPIHAPPAPVEGDMEGGGGHNFMLPT